MACIRKYSGGRAVYFWQGGSPDTGRCQIVRDDSLWAEFEAERATIAADLEEAVANIKEATDMAELRRKSDRLGTLCIRLGIDRYDDPRMAQAVRLAESVRTEAGMRDAVTNPEAVVVSFLDS